MKLIFLISLVTLVVATKHYDSNNDDLDIDAIVANMDTLKEWYNCFVNDATCNPVQSEFKSKCGYALPLSAFLHLQRSQQSAALCYFNDT